MAGYAPESDPFPLHIQPLAGYAPENGAKTALFHLFGRVSAGMACDTDTHKASSNNGENTETGWVCSGLSR